MVKINTVNKISTTGLALGWIAIFSSQPVYGMENQENIDTRVQTVLTQTQSRPAFVVLNEITTKLNLEKRPPTDWENFLIESVYSFITNLQKDNEKSNEWIKNHKEIIGKKKRLRSVKIENPEKEESVSQLQNRLAILGSALPFNKTRVFNEYLKLKEKYKAPYFPSSCYIFETHQDYIAKFYAERLTFIVPEILRDETLNLDLRARIELADRHESDLKAFNREVRWSYKTPPRVAEFYKSIAEKENTELADSEKFNILKRLFTLSEEEGKKIILKLLKTKNTPFGLKHKVAHFIKETSDKELKEVAQNFIKTHSKEILKDAKMHYKNLTTLSKMEISLLHIKEALEQGITVAVCDTGFFKVIPSTHTSKLMTEYGTDERSLQWKLLHQKRLLPVKTYDASWLTQIKNFSFPYHGSEMSDLVVTISPKTQVLPVAIDTNNTHSIIEALEILALDKTVHIINCSFGLPQDYNQKVPVVDPEVKNSIRKCLENNKLLILAAGNSGLTIPEKPEMPERTKPLDTIGGGLSGILFEQEVACQPSVISGLFEGEEENSPFFTNLLLVGSSKANSLELHDKSVRPGNGPAQKRFIYADADDMRNFFDELPNWGGTSAATAMVSGILADLWGRVKNPNEQTAARVSRALLENTDINENLPLSVRGLGKVNAGKALEKLDNY